MMRREMSLEEEWCWCYVYLGQATGQKKGRGDPPHAFGWPSLHIDPMSSLIHMSSRFGC